MPNKIVSSLFWQYLNQSGTQVAQFVVSIVLARLLAPEDFGLIALVLVVISIADVFVQCGMSAALVQKKDAESKDYSTVFWLSLAIATVVYTIIFFGAPLLASFYKNEGVIPIIRVLGIALFIGGLNSTLSVYVQKNFLFKKMFFRSIAVNIPCGIFGITLAYFKFGVWALVAQHLASCIVSVVFLLFIVPWKPTFEFSIVSAKRFFNYGYKILLTNLSHTVCYSLTTLLIGKFFSPATLGHYNRGENLPKIIVNNVMGTITTVLFPALAELQDDLHAFRHRVRLCIKCSCFLMFPLMALMASMALPTVIFLLGEKWLPCVVFVQITCFTCSFFPMLSTSKTAINSLGRSGTTLKLEVLNKIIGMAALAIALFVYRTPEAIAVSFALTSPIGMFINAFPNKKYLNYGFGEQFMDVIPTFMLAIVCGAVVFPITYIHNIPSYAMIALQGSIGMGLYILLARMFKMEAYNYIYGTFKERFMKSRKSA